MSARDFTALFPFGGSGGGALGFLDAEVRLLGTVGRFRCLGSIDLDAEACVDFERFTGAHAWCADVQQVSGADLVERYGVRAPDVVFMSPPCKGSSRLLSASKAKTEKYRRMNDLAVVWTEAMLDAWGDDPPSLVLLENVPGLPSRAASMLRRLRKLLRTAGYVFHATTHDCGEIGGHALRCALSRLPAHVRVASHHGELGPRVAARRGAGATRPQEPNDDRALRPFGPRWTAQSSRGNASALAHQRTRKGHGRK